MKMLEGGSGVRLRARYRYKSPILEIARNVLSPQHPLTMMRVSSSNGVTTAEFMPVGLDKPRKGIQQRDFKGWWNEIVFVAGAAKLGGDQSMIPIRDEEQIPYESRVKLSRQQIVRLYRNKFGSHTDRNIPKKLRLLIDEGSWGAGIMSGDPKNPTPVKIQNSPIEATICQIGKEICASVVEG